MTAAGPASAYQPVNIVHTEHVQAGPYALTIGFSEWPLRAMQSLDFTFAPDGGVDGLSGTLTEVLPNGKIRRAEDLSRHPRKREVWGLDVRSLDQEGAWTFRFAIDGPEGHGVGEFTNLTVLRQPGPPLGLSWAVSSIPLIGLIVFLAYAWRRTRRPVLQPA
ncbi:hypothetical protein GL305_17055 [Nocardia seriolae]|nr:hypothetical protein [Nocardia seriolae]MTJ73608.1 hypothetical protein [Nocardia seriolae]MTJ87638.1 hypothetical protein [Nocardia seriolae]MTK31631.1 hypothetical protein [Nocardia seriolae]MTK42232.1 hypothetical protein [Nocardia seriolae]